MASTPQGFTGRAPETVAYDPSVAHTGASAPYGAVGYDDTRYSDTGYSDTGYSDTGHRGRSGYDDTAVGDIRHGSVPARSVTPRLPSGAPTAGLPTEPPGAEPWDEWNPTEESTRPLRGKHRVAKQRTGGVARGGAVLGVGMIAAVGAGGMATAHDKDPGAISVPDLDTAADTVRSIPDHLPDAEDLPGIGSLISDGSNDSNASDGSEGSEGAAATDDSAGKGSEAAGNSDAGEALRARILAQAEQRRFAEDSKAREEAAREAASAAAEEAAKRAAAEQKAEEKAKAERAREAAEAKRKAEAERKRKAEAQRRAELARSYTAPLASFQLTAGFGQAGGMWQNDHTGQDFAAPNGTPVKAIHGGTIKEAGWAGSYGYRIVLKLEDGTELWFCHLSSMTKSAGDKVGTGDVIGRVGSTGNSSGPHLHVEVRPGGGDPVDPLPWLRAKGVDV
ncbi:M23 family metallopeptidase [Streptomyces oryzae]|uniref:M23 family metallopeptidase n=1 Tax=Streptomyces oryzae TaxID=1434886 RepID=A0ABS3XA33_9ACTN|nr:M23 family metallopeptidase [Streptomyces oryzae]MBO8192174.1 M23 family metallopeptidase [Streptomyces oryzae]